MSIGPNAASRSSRDVMAWRTRIAEPPQRHIITVMWAQFRAFIARGNVVDLAIGVIIGAAFGKIVTTLVEGVIMPPLGLVLGKVDFGSLLIVLDRSKGMPLSLADAKAKG